MRWGLAAAGCALVVACGARSEIAGESELGVDAGSGSDTGVDATLDVAHDAVADAKDAAVDSPIDATPDGTLCCDLGFKQSGCQTCAADEQCWNKVGSCLHTVTNCGPWNCQGCCESATTCSDGREVGNCGNHGQLCQTCIDSKNKVIACIADDAGNGGTCLGGPTCTDQNCHPGGCCNGNICALGDQDTLCGNGGACVDCTQNGGTCVNQACVFPHQ